MDDTVELDPVFRTSGTDLRRVLRVRSGHRNRRFRTSPGAKGSRNGSRSPFTNWRLGYSSLGHHPSDRPTATESLRLPEGGGATTTGGAGGADVIDCPSPPSAYPALSNYRSQFRRRLARPRPSPRLEPTVTPVRPVTEADGDSTLRGKVVRCASPRGGRRRGRVGRPLVSLVSRPRPGPVAVSVCVNRSGSGVDKCSTG